MFAGMVFYMNRRQKLTGLIFCLCFIRFMQAQAPSRMIPVPKIGDTLLVMQDNLPKTVRHWPFRSDSTRWDLNGVRAPFIRKIVIRDAAADPVALRGSNAWIETGFRSKEFYWIDENTLKSIGVTGVDLFGDGHSFTGYWFPQRIRRQSIYMPGFPPEAKYKLIYPCALADLPQSLRDQLPYQPDSVKIVTSVTEQARIQDSVSLDLHLYRHSALRRDLITAQTTRIETKKAGLEWQDVTRFVRFPKIFRTDSLRETFFYSPALRDPVAVIRYKNLQEPDQITYKAPDIYKDLIVVEDFKPNLFFFPNPYTFGTLRIDLLINDPGLYTLRLVNLIGKEVWRENHYLEGNKTLDYSFTHLQKGTYFMIFQQDENHVIGTKRLLVLKP